MHLNISQQMKMSQQMKLAPRMIQSMEILQLPLMELKERIEQELIENPLLEDLGGTPESPAPDADSPEVREPSDEGGEPFDLPSPAEKPLEQKELVVDNDHNNQDDFERLSELGDDWQDDESFSPRVSASRSDEEGDRALDQMANIVARPPSLQEHLLEQLHFFDSPPHVRAFAEYLVQNLDPNGRLTGPLDELLRAYTLEFPTTQVTPAIAQQALDLVQQLDPRGVGACDLKECFLLQIDPDTPHRDLLITLIKSYLEDLAENRLPVIERRTGYNLDTIKAAREELLKLNPRPGRDFEHSTNQNVVPDLFVEPDDHGKWVVHTEDEYTPRLRISKRYRQLLASGKADPQTREYIKKKIEAAKWLIESIEQRYSTVRRVAQAIVDRQVPFLVNGPEHIVPLKMQQIADDVGVHVTTVSRAVDDKFIQTPRGIFPLKRFFGGGTTTAEGEEVAWDIIRIKLREIVDKEDKSDPLSDDALMAELAKQGYNLARRTITKYRKALDIPSSRQRKVY